MPDFGSPNFILGLIGAGAAVVYFVYRLQNFTMPLINGMLNSNTQSAEERAAHLMQRYKEETNHLGYEPRSIAASSPRIQMLRVATQDTDVKCLMVNRGGHATNLKVESFAAKETQIEPQSIMENGQTGSISLSGVTALPDLVQFELSYNDSTGMRVIRKYAYSEQQKTFIEV